MDQLATLPPPRARAGRPTREQAEARHEELLEVALDHFLDKGYETATIEAIASAVGMTKRTVYGLYADKAALFHAAVHRAILRYSISEERIRATDCGDLEQTLCNIALLRIGLVASPQGLKYETINTADAFSVALTDLETFELDYVERNLKVRIKNGKTYNFTDQQGGPDGLFVFQRDVEKVRQRIIAGR